MEYEKFLEKYKKDPVSTFEEMKKSLTLDHQQTVNNNKNNLVPYPELNDVNFNKIIFNKKEFNLGRKKNIPDTCGQDSFELSTNQKFLKNFLSPFTPYNGLLLFHSVGVGKTCTAISIAERYYEIYHKKVIVILSANIKDNFKKQIFDITKYNVNTNESSLCTGTTYPDMIINKHIDLEKKINKFIKEKYKFIGYKEFVSDIAKMKDNESVDFFSDKLIIIDEAHNLRPSKKGNKQIFTTFTHLLKKTTNVKMLLMTATPMFDEAQEIISLLNLLLVNDKRPLIKIDEIFDKNKQITSKGESYLKEISRGYVSFMRGENPYTFPKRLFPSINKDPKVLRTFPLIDIYGQEIPSNKMITSDNIEIVGSDMSLNQYTMYENDKSTGNDDDDDNIDEAAAGNDDDDDDENMNKKDMQSKIQLSNITYPSTLKHYGKKGFYSCFEESKDQGFKVKYNSKSEQILSYQNVGNYSSKIKSILDYIINSKGIVFVYSQYYYSGIIPLALALEHIGFEKYNTQRIGQFTLKKEDRKFTNIPKYAILSNDRLLSPNNNQYIDVAKSKANENGELIKVIIVSKIGTEGIDFKRIRELHIMEPWFNLSRTEQIIGRAVRRCSHFDMAPEDRNVTIYLHASTFKQKETIDLQMYRISENKFNRIKKVENILKSNAIDCEMNIRQLSFPKDKVNIKLNMTTSQGNVIEMRLGDEKNDMVKCSIHDQKYEEDKTTFNKVFIEDEITLYKKYIGSLYSKENKVFSYQEIIDLLLKDYNFIDAEILIFALDELVSKQEKVLSDSGYLIYRSDKYIFQHSKINDTRIGIEEREKISPSRPDKINFRHFVDASKEDDDTIFVITKRKPHHKKENANATNSKDEHDIIKYIEKRVDDISSKIIHYIDSKKTGKYEKNILEYVIDRLDKKLFMECIYHFVHYDSLEEVTNHTEKKILSILLGNKVIFLEKGGKKIKFIYSHFDQDILFLRENLQFEKKTPLDIIKVKDEYDDFQEFMKAKTESKNVQGFIQGIKFKIKENPKSKGQVCTTAVVDLLKTKITDLDGSVSFENVKNPKREVLCDMLEIIIRSKGSNAFIREYEKVKTPKIPKQKI